MYVIFICQLYPNKATTKSYHLTYGTFSWEEYQTANLIAGITYKTLFNNKVIKLVIFGGKRNFSFSQAISLLFHFLLP